MKRRSFLATLGVSTAPFTTGCLAPIEDALDDTPAQLGWVGIYNFHPEPQEFEVQIKREGDVVHELRHKLDGHVDENKPGIVPIPAVALKCTWGDAPGPYTLRGRVAGGRWAEVVLDQVFDDESPDCIKVRGELFSGLKGMVRFEADGFSWHPRTCDDPPSYRKRCAFRNSDS
jgi:hypothetical protein